MTLSQAGKITGMPISAYVNEPKTAAVKIQDNESGLNFEECKWTYTNFSEELGTTDEDLGKYTGKLTAESQTVTMKATEVGTWYLHVLVTDNAGNRVEVISEAGVTASALPTSITSGTTFGYNGSVQNFKVLVSGVYKLEVWGAKGGSGKSQTGGNGGYSYRIQISVRKYKFIYLLWWKGRRYHKSLIKPVLGGYNGGASR